MQLESAHILPDVLAPDLRVVFCGTAASTVSAQRGAYYANPTNRFWRTLYEIGLTPRLLSPSEFRSVTDYGIGLTDLVKHRFGQDVTLRRDDFDPAGLRAKIERYQPRALAFDSKNAAQVFYGHKVDYGQQAEPFGATMVFVLPSTSGAARKFWDVSYWHLLAEWVKSL
jgi:double-stranded uracil-DNA glycosylase